MDKIVALEDFEGANDPNGVTTKSYKQGEIYEVHEVNGKCFVEGKLAKYYEEPKVETKTAEAGKGKAAASVKSDLRDASK